MHVEPSTSLPTEPPVVFGVDHGADGSCTTTVWKREPDGSLSMVDRWRVAPETPAAAPPPSRPGCAPLLVVAVLGVLITLARWALVASLLGWWA
jgi:hypothetical protein